MIPETLNFIHENRFLIDKIKLLTKKIPSDKRSRYSLVKSVSVLPCVCDYMIKHFIYINFVVFVKILISKPKTIFLKSTPLIMASCDTVNCFVI